MSKKLGDKELEELMNPDSWDDSKLEILEPARRPRAVVSVAFQRDDFELVARQARRSGMTTSGFIREAALNVAKASTTAASIQWIGHTAGAFLVQIDPAPNTRRVVPVEQFDMAAAG